MKNLMNENGRIYLWQAMAIVRWLDSLYFLILKTFTITTGNNIMISV